MIALNSEGPDDLFIGGRGHPRTDLFPTVPIAVFAEPPPALAPPEREVFLRMLRGAWFWSMRKVHGLRVSEDDKGQYAVKREDIDLAHLVFIDKAIAPGAWLAWRSRAFMQGPSVPMPLGWVLSVSMLTDPKRRGWFRRDTEGYFGGKAVPTPAQIELLRRWRLARSTWARGMHPDDALDLAALDPAAQHALEHTAANEVEKARVRCQNRALKGDPMAVLSPDLWPFGFKEKE